MTIMGFNLPIDYSRCVNDKCDLRHNCMRFLTDTPKGKYVSMIMGKPENGECESQIKLSENDMFE